MIFVADENIEFYVVSALRKIGYEVEYIAEMAAGATDSNILQNAYLENKVLLTHDKDFGDLVYRKQFKHCGIILIRMHGIGEMNKVSIISEVIKQHSNILAQSYIVIQKNVVRIRRM